MDLTLISRKLNGAIWKAVVAADGASLILDVRNEEKHAVEYQLLDLNSFDLEVVGHNPNWWSTLEGFDKGVFVTEYQNRNDPSNKRNFFIANGTKETVEDLPEQNQELIHPFLYEGGTAYHQVVSDFLGLALPLSCEYLEYKRNIIISYYLRSDKVFDRFLLILEDGHKKLKEMQDAGISGFAAGAFFLLKEKLFYIKERNEICIYSLYPRS